MGRKSKWETSEKQWESEVVGTCSGEVLEGIILFHQPATSQRTVLERVLIVADSEVSKGFG